MPRQPNPTSDLPLSTKRLHQFMNETGKSRSQFASELGLSISGLNNIFLRGSKVSETLARATEQAFGVNHRWILHGDEPKIVGNNALNPSDIWRLNMSSPFQYPSYLTMWELPKTLVTTAFQRKLMEMEMRLVFKRLTDHQVAGEVRSWYGQISNILLMDLQDLITELPVNEDEAQRFSGKALIEFPEDQRKQWLTGYYYLMDLVIAGQEDRISNEAEKLSLEIDLQWIDQHREKFHGSWFGLCSRVEQALADAPEERLSLKTDKE